MRADLTALALLGALLAGVAHAKSPGPDPHRFACEGDRTLHLVQYYLDQTVRAASKDKGAQVQLSRFGYDRDHCYARVDVDTSTDSGIVWAWYVVSEQPTFSIRLWLTKPLSTIADLPTKEHAKVLNASLEKEMRTSGYLDRFKDMGPKLPITRLEALGEARKKLLATGWKPIKAAEDDEGWNGAKEFRDAGYVETEDCAMDVSICMLRYSKGQDACLNVAVDGETPAAAFVDSWDFTCPKS